MAAANSRNTSSLSVARYFFVGVSLLAFLMIVYLYYKLGGTSGYLVREVLSNVGHDSHQHFQNYEEAFKAWQDSGEDYPHKHEGSDGVGHNHNEEVHFVLHESGLGAPEFIGRNHRTANYIEMDDSKTYLNAPVDSVAGVFNVDNYKDNNIAIGVAITTRNQNEVRKETLSKELPFFTGLLRSFCATATRGFRYNFYVAHDHYDPFFQHQHSHSEFTEVFYEMMSSPKCARVGFNVTLHLVDCQHSGRPAWAQNDAMMAAYLDNMDYYYRINDDTVMETTGWTEKFIDELERFNPPRVGVVGPWFREGNVVILTHDFVHRTHVDILGFYYPRVFTDWFADDWITGVYWPERCRKVPGTRVKHTMVKGQRYVAHYDRAAQVKIEVEIGKMVIQRYIERHEQSTSRGIIWNSESRNVISMSLDGDDVNLLYGALRYSQLVPVLLPKWRLRVYVSAAALNSTSSSRVFRILIRKLENSGVEVLRVRGLTAERVPPVLWPYLVADDLDVDRFIVRESDMRPTEREMIALEDWMSMVLTKPLYCIRDHPAHAVQELTPGLIGGIPRALRNVTSTKFRMLMRGYKLPSEFLKKAIWPLLKSHCMCHDSVSCSSWLGAYPFPVLRHDNEFVGQHFDVNDQPVYNDEVLTWNRSFVQPTCVFVKNTGFDEKAVKAVIRNQPVLWSQDYHITPIMDVKSLLGPLGVKVIDQSLSYYCRSVGTCANQLKVINSDNGLQLENDTINQFYKAYRDDPEMRSVTSFVCTLPVAMCEAFVPFQKPLIIIATIRYEQGRSEPVRWRALNELLLNVSQSSRSVLAANNLYDAKYIQYFTGIQPMVLPNYCAYLSDTYKPTRKQFLVSPIHSNDLYDVFYAEFDNIIMKKGVNLVMFPLREMYPQYLYSDLTSHRGIVYIPYQVSMISLTEQYRMNIPLFFPSRNLLTKWHMKYQVVRQRTWSGYMDKRASQSAIAGVFSKVPDPNNDLEEEAVNYWLQFSDFYQWPHIIYFESIEDLVDKMMTVDLMAISQRMAKYNERVRQEIKDKWSKILLKVTEGTQMTS